MFNSPLISKLLNGVAIFFFPLSACFRKFHFSNIFKKLFNCKNKQVITILFYFCLAFERDFLISIFDTVEMEPIQYCGCKLVKQTQHCQLLMALGEDDLLMLHLKRGFL
jgi:hypothetical protein